LYENSNPSEPLVAVNFPAPKHGLFRRAGTGATVASLAMLGLSLFGASASASVGDHRVASASHGVASGSSKDGGGGGGGGSNGTWDQSKVPLPHLPGQAPIFDRNLQSQSVADVVALDQTSEPAADASMIAFYENNTACTVDTHGGPNVQDTITCPKGTATTTDALDGSTWVHVFRLVK
jgi:hypothetical protein